MNIPNVQNAVVSEDKILGYLLSDEKSDFFVRHGFSVAQWRQLEAALKGMP